MISIVVSILISIVLVFVFRGGEAFQGSNPVAFLFDIALLILVGFGVNYLISLI
ncbi:MAG TPA: hypothetical protein PLZ43_14495 [bacterium]|nr:hypothetical protein [bacterium]